MKQNGIEIVVWKNLYYLRTLVNTHVIMQIYQY